MFAKIGRPNLYNVLMESSKKYKKIKKTEVHMNLLSVVLLKRYRLLKIHR